ncbi:AAA family ATPase [Bacteroides acidifaciens]|uniref:AAA family ATPase n=1 Tax=Bacteroides acidifaciens TaxID=85831 RepID=UPI0025581385|nr:ATP-binding protein [Bacteroides acidifaciens]
MLQELKIRNFKSFRDEVELSFEPTGNDRYNSVVTMPDGVNLLRFAVVLGANASGKSNLLDAIEFLHVFWNKIPMTNDDGTDVQPFLMRSDALSHDTEFEVKLYIDGIRYWYQLVINPEKVCHENLYVYLSDSPTKVFSREDVNGISKLNFNPDLVKLSSAEVEVMTMNCLRNMSVLAVLKKVNVSVPYLDNMRKWIDNRMLPLQSGSFTSLSHDVKRLLADSPEFREYLMQFAKEADFNISDIKIQKMVALFGHTVENESGVENYFLPESCQSAGTKRMVELESLIYTQLKRQAFMCIDEIEASMHPNLMEYILTKFVNSRDNHSQLLVSTHYDPILKDIEDIFGKDSVWFTEKGKDGNTTLFSLADFKGLNKLSSIHRAYMNGQFGALPNVLV